MYVCMYVCMYVLGVQHFVFLSSMGGTQPENFLNTIGRIVGDELSGNILLWKRKAEVTYMDEYIYVHTELYSPGVYVCGYAGTVFNVYYIHTCSTYVVIAGGGILVSSTQQIL